MSLSRRTFLRGAGIALSLPMLDAMVPAFRRTTSAAEVSLNPPRRMIAIQTNMGILSQHFFPTTTGADFELTAYLDILKDFKSKMTVLSGVSHPDVDGAHEAERSFLSAAPTLLAKRFASSDTKSSELRPRPRSAMRASTSAGFPCRNILA